VHEVVRAGYDGVIIDLEGVDHSYPAIQQVFARYNQRLWAVLRGLNKWYGIALIPKVRDNDYNFFENWRLLAFGWTAAGTLIDRTGRIHLMKTYY